MIPSWNFIFAHKERTVGLTEKEKKLLESSKKVNRFMGQLVQLAGFVLVFVGGSCIFREAMVSGNSTSQQFFSMLIYGFSGITFLFGLVFIRAGKKMTEEYSDPQPSRRTISLRFFGGLLMAVGGAMPFGGCLSYVLFSMNRSYRGSHSEDILIGVLCFIVLPAVIGIVLFWIGKKMRK